MGGSACKIIFHGDTLKADVCLLTGGTIYGDAG